MSATECDLPVVAVAHSRLRAFVESWGDGEPVKGLHTRDIAALLYAVEGEPRPALTVHDLVAAVERAEAEAQTQHKAGTCHLSEWSCSYCEAEGRDLA